VAHAILNGETETGVTIIRITSGLDAGEMLAQELLTIGPEETTGELEARLAVLGAKMSVDIVMRMKHGSVSGVKQDSTLVTKAPKITKEMGLIDWTAPATVIVNHIRAMQPWPTAYTFFHRQNKEPIRVMICRGRSVNVAISGTYYLHNGSMVGIPPNTIPSIVCGSESALELCELQPAGKKRMTAEEFFRGYSITEGSRFGPERLA
jgi:methionyl-tRNA formyltransferase